jgi:uncharacterized protein (TIGR02145 family)
MKRSVIALIILIISTIITIPKIYAQDRETFTDNRDGHAYKIKKIGTQVWMAENLTYKTNSGCWAYDNDESKASIYGYLYDYQTAKTVCPIGWKLPSKSDFDTLSGYYGNDHMAAYQALIPGGVSGFNALFSGCRYDDGNFYGLNDYAHFWSSSQDSEKYAWFLYIFGNHKKAGMGSFHKSYAFSVRCLQNE